MEYKSQNEQDWLRDINSLATPKNVAEWSKGTPEGWATETLLVAKKAYRLPWTERVIPSGTKLGDDYVRMAAPVIQEQLAKAGIRIAWTLNEIFW
jgi:hypothetical protein